ncbi:MAG: hypothetical protein ACREJC_03010 [Tepidisphaeraceae bacterium]
MKVREFNDGSYQFLPESGDAEYPIEPRPPAAPPLLAVLKAKFNTGTASAAELAVLNDLETAAAAAQASFVRGKEEFDRKKPAADFAAIAASAPAEFKPKKTLSKAEIDAAPWLKSRL